MDKITDEMIKNLGPENTTNLVGIGTKQDDFESVPSNGKPYTFLGKGAFGFAEKMKSKLNNKFYAIKKLPVQKEGFTKDFKRETIFMLSLNNEYVVKLYGYFQGIEKIEKIKEIYKDDKKGRFQNETNDIKMYFLVLDYMANGSLEDYYENSHKTSQKIEQSFIIKIFKQLLIGLKYLHDNKIMHRDIKLDNILLDENNNIKISDFGISAIHRESVYDDPDSNILISNATRVGRKDFVAPEILKGSDFDYKVDIFSLGLTMLCLVSKSHPISLENRKRTIFTHLVNDTYDIFLVNLIKKMLLENPVLRPSADDALIELEKVEKYINDPSEGNKKKLLFLSYPPENFIHLKGIGVRPEDFESIKSDEGEDYTILGKGMYGYCELLKSKVNNKIYAVKKTPVKKTMSADFIRETTFMINLSHPNIVRMYGYFQGIEKIEKLKNIYKKSKPPLYQNDTDDKKIYFLVLDYMTNGSIDDHYAKVRGKKQNIEQDFIIKAMKQILSGLKYLHSQNIIHRDIKPDNLLIDEDNNFHISDFGISAIVKPDQNQKQDEINPNKDVLISNCTLVGPRYFSAPEIGTKKAGVKSDIFSLGLTMLCLVSRDNPITFNNQNKRIINQNIIIDIYNPYLIKLIQRMILDDIDQRPDVESVLDEVKKIEAFIKDPDNQKLKEDLDKKNMYYNQQMTQVNSQYNTTNMPNYTNINNTMYPNYNQGNNTQYNTGYNNINNSIYPTAMPNNQTSIGMSTYFENPYYQPTNVGLYNPTFFNDGTKMNFTYMNNYANQFNTGASTQMDMNNIYLTNCKISSLMCCLKCLYFCFQDDLNNLINKINYSSNYMNVPSTVLKFILNMIKFMGLEPQNQMDLMNLNNTIKTFRYQLYQSSKLEGFGGMEEISPCQAFYEIYNKIIMDSRVYYFEMPSNNIKQLEAFNGIDRDDFENVFKDIAKFKSNKDGPFTDYFYYVQIETLRCRNPNCNVLVSADIKWGSQIEFQGPISGSISNFMFNYFPQTLSDYNNCGTCLMNDKQDKKTSLLVKPKFILINFTGMQIAPKKLDIQLDLSQYNFSKGNIGPNKYSLFACVCKNNYNVYVAFIKKPDGWYFYNNGQLAKQMYVNFDSVCPNIVIYKGES